MTRTAIVRINGDRYVFRDEEVDRMVEIGRESLSVDEAWRELKRYGEDLAAADADVDDRA